MRKTEINTRLNLMISFMAAPTLRSLAWRRRLYRVGGGRRLRQILFREEDAIPLGMETHVRDHGLTKLRILGPGAHALDQGTAQLGRSLEPLLDIRVGEVPQPAWRHFAVLECGQPLRQVVAVVHRHARDEGRRRARLDNAPLVCPAYVELS